MMWNALVSTLLLRASIVMIDGNPGATPTSAFQWRLAEEMRPTMMGVSPAFVMACRKAGRRARARTSTSPRSARSAPPARRSRSRASSGSTSRSTRTCSSTSAAAAPTSARGIVQGNPLLPVYARRDRRALPRRRRRRRSTPDGEPVVGELGELVIRQPMPSMPVGFWNDPDGARYRAAYFDHYPGVWRHGDWIMFTERGSSRDHRPLRRDAQPRRRPAGHERVLLRGRGARRGARQPRRPPRGRDATS